MKSIIITGVSSGIGEKTAQLFAYKNWRVYGIDVKKPQSYIKNMEFFKADVRETKELQKIKEGIEEIDALFNNAAVLDMGPFWSIESKKLTKMVDVNVNGVINTTKTFLSLLKPKSVVINMCSISALYGTPELSVYSATKAAIKSLTESLHIELKNRGVDVCDILTGYVNTPLLKNSPYKARSIDILGFDIKASDISRLVYKIAISSPHRKIHYFIGCKTKAITLISFLFPTIKPIFAQILSGYKK